MTQQLGKSSKVSGFVYLALSKAQIAPDPLVEPLSAKAERLQKTGHFLRQATSNFARSPVNSLA
ncbi:hypothetical protein QUB68_29505 [Microcoleus sp. A006_D1]|uniref:hypothetical protein n=1 Tax=Microcoleus sp. A006_D1 TaxID=3055267 RepID=UPI002FD532BE